MQTSRITLAAIRPGIENRLSLFDAAQPARVAGRAIGRAAPRRARG